MSSLRLAATNWDSCRSTGIPADLLGENPIRIQIYFRHGFHPVDRAWARRKHGNLSGLPTIKQTLSLEYNKRKFYHFKEAFALVSTEMVSTVVSTT